MAEVGKAGERMEKAVVARGRSIMIPTADKHVGGFDPNGKEVMVPTMTTVEENHEIELPAAEVKRLRGLGYLHDPARQFTPVSDGPHYTEFENKGGIGFQNPRGG